MIFFTMTQKTANGIIGALGILVAGISLVAFIGVLIGNDSMRSWGRPYPMPLNVTVCLIAIGMALFLLAHRDTDKG